MRQSISILRTDVMTEVRKTLEYMGSHHVTEGGNMYDVLSATPEQVEQLDRYFDEGCADIAVHTKKYVSEWSASETFAISYELNEGYKIQMLDVVKQDMFSYLVNSIISKWLMLCNLASDRIQLYSNMATLYLQSIKRSILIHTGKDERSSAGCIIVGKNTIKGGLTESLKCLRELYKQIKDKECWITIE